ncbi:hypothetical protein OCEANICA350_12022 [Oceanicaulis sp. 350]|nr:hypothetical protein OCEANICA350_12022 [Oceanicaulis sp. 350]
MNDLMLALTILMALAAYTLAGYVSLRAVRPYRVELARLGKKLLSSPNIEENEKVVISRMLTDAFKWQIGWKLLRSLVQNSREEEFIASDEERRKRYEDFKSNEEMHKFVKLFIYSIFAANPLAAAAMIFYQLILDLFSQITRKSTLGKDAAWHRVYIYEACER